MVKKIGRFEVIRLLGKGGMAEVYLANDTLMQREVAIKLLPRHFLHDPQFKARFEREARVLAKLNHQGVVPIHDFGYHEEQPYMISRYMPGGSLETRLRSGRVSLAEALNILESICAALEYAHKKGVVHRDIKPGNILFDEEGQAYVADFGIAKLAQSSSVLTGTAIIGTPAYMSPEQFEGRRELDGRSDQYSLAIVLFEMLSGKLPFQADTTAKFMHMHLMEPPPSLNKLRRGIPLGVADVLDRALRKKASERFSTIGLLLTAFKKATSGQESIVDPTGKQIRAKTTRLIKNTQLKNKQSKVREQKLRGIFRRDGVLWPYAAFLAAVVLIALMWNTLQSGLTSAAPEASHTPLGQATLLTEQPTVGSTSTVRPSETPTAITAETTFNGPVMPDVVGLHYRDAVAVIEAAGLEFNLDNYRMVCDFGLPVGIIKRQLPEAGDPIAGDTDVVLYRTGIPARMENGYGNFVIYSRSGVTEYVADLRTGNHKFDVIVWWGNPVTVNKVELLDADGNVVYSFQDEINNSSVYRLEAGPRLPQDGCYIARVYFSSTATDAQLAGGFSVGSVSIYGQ